MPSIKPERNQMYLLPPSIDEWISGRHPARFVAGFVETIDLEHMGFKEESAEGRPAYSNEMLLSIWLYGMMNGIRSCRKLEKELHDSIAMVWLTGNKQPDHNTLWRFFSNNRKRIKEVFKGTVKMAMDYNMVGFELQAIDGTRIQAYANNDRTITLKGQAKKLEAVEKEIEEIMTEVEKNENAEDDNNDKGYKLPEKLLDKEEMKKAIKKSMEELKEKGRKEMNETDVDARFVKIRNVGIKQGYNAQAVVDGKKQIITGASVCNESDDRGQLTGMIKEAAETTGKATAETVVDKGYYSQEELTKAEKMKAKVLMDLRNKEKAGRYGKSNFSYDKEKDEYVCPDGKRLTYGGAVMNRGLKEHKYICRSYNGCPAHAECTGSKRGRMIKATDNERLIERMKEEAVRENWAEKLKKRMHIVEPVFGHIKEVIGLRRFSVRGLEKVSAQWYFTCTIHNLKKLYGRWIQKQSILQT